MFHPLKKRSRRSGKERKPTVKLRIVAWSFLAASLVMALTQAAGDLTRQEPIVVTVQLGDKENALKFFPDHLRFESGKLYRLRLVNKSPSPHYFTSPRFAEAVFTRKVEVLGSGGERVAEIKGPVREIEVFPGGIAEWWFVPVRSGSFDDLKCTIEGHSAMTGRIEVR